MSVGPDALSVMRTMMAQGLGTPLFIDDVPGHLFGLAQSMDTAAGLSAALADAPAVSAMFHVEHSSRADTMRHAAMMVRALQLNIAQGLQQLADEQALQVELPGRCAACGGEMSDLISRLCDECIGGAA